MTNRELFEAWFESRYDAHFMQFVLDLDMYVDKHTQTCWEAWQASTQREGFKFVPVNPDNKVISILASVICDEFNTTIDGSAHCAKEAYKSMIGTIND